MGLVALAVGLVLCLEGLVLALAPSRVEDLLDLLARLPMEARRLIGLLALAIGGGFLALARVSGVI